MSAPVQQVFQPLIEMFKYPLFRLGDVAISLSWIFNLVLSILAVFFLCRLFSEWLKKKLLVRLGIDSGTREAIATITAYITGTLGFFIILQTAGINLNSLTVLAGGLGIGLGFGLQDLAKNFISGLTLLIERPIKVGDFIEVGSLEGSVQRISIRSTVIRTNNGVSVIVPNIEFVENKIINWSHHNTDSRIHIPVGVEYGSDPLVVTEILLSSAYMEPRVLANPAARVWFVGFGDHALNFELLVWIDQPQNKDPIKSALNFIIEHELRQKGINIPFPQRDVWLKNPEELGNLLQKFTPKAISQAADDITENGQVSTDGDLAQTQPKPLYLRDLLRQVDYFENFTNLELLQLIEQGYRQTIAPKKFIFRENDPGDCFYIILSGSVEVFSEKANKYLTTLHRGDFFGELSLLMGIPRSATVKTLEETIVFNLNQKGLQQLLNHNQRLADQIAQKLAERQQELAERQQSLRDLGLVDEADLDQSPLVWVRKRLKTLFGI